MEKEVRRPGRREDPHPLRREIQHEAPISSHKMRHFLFTWLEKRGIDDDALIQPYSGLKIYSLLAIGEAQNEYNEVIGESPV